MIPASFDYLRPATITEALQMASSHPAATFLAGGHALLPQWKLQHAGPSVLIDLGGIEELRGIKILENADPPHEGGNLRPGVTVRIGAMTTSAEIEHSAEISRIAPLLTQAATLISDPLIRNRATLGGSLAEADPRGDWPPVILAVDATIHLRSRDGERTVPAHEFFTHDATHSPRPTVLRPGELLTAITVPAAGPLTRHTYLKRMHPASGHAMLGIAATLNFDVHGTCRDCRIAITGTATVAVRATRAERRLTGSRLTPGDIEAAAHAATEGITFTGDIFGSASYLGDLLPIYINRALTQLTAAPANS